MATGRKSKKTKPTKRRKPVLVGRGKNRQKIVKRKKPVKQVDQKLLNKLLRRVKDKNLRSDIHAGKLNDMRFIELVFQVGADDAIAIRRETRKKFKLTRRKEKIKDYRKLKFRRMPESDLKDILKQGFDGPLSQRGFIELAMQAGFTEKEAYTQGWSPT